MSNQLIKETALGREQVFPKNYILNLKDKDSGVNLEDILKSFNMLFLSYLGNKVDTRKQVPMSLRHGGLWITYIVDNTVVTEWYDNTTIDDYTWGSDAYWREGSNMLVGDISISKQGTWVINGEDTGISPKGDKGDSPVIRIYNNRVLVSYDNGVTFEDLNNTPVFTLFRFNSTTNTYQVSYDLGVTWQDVLPDKVYYKFRYNQSTNTYLESVDFGKTWSNISAEKVYYQFRYNEETNTHLVSTDLGQNWTDVSSNKVYYQFRTNDNRLLVSTDLGTTWEDCSELIAAWFRWAEGDTADSVGKLLISRDELKTWTDLSPNIVNNLRIKGYVAAVGNLPSNAALGDIYMVGPTYDDSDTAHNYPRYRMWVKLSSGWVDNGEYLSIQAGVVQELGDNPNVVISLKVTTQHITANKSRILELEKSQWPLVLTLELSSELLEYTNVNQPITVTYKVYHKGALKTPNALTLTKDGVDLKAEVVQSKEMAVNVNKLGTTEFILKAKAHSYYEDSSAEISDIIENTISKKLQMVLPIYAGFGKSATDVVVDANKLSVRTSAAGTYTKTAAADGVNFFILVPATFTKLTSFTMGGAPFVMKTSTITAGKFNQSYIQYKSGATYNTGATVNIKAS